MTIRLRGKPTPASAATPAAGRLSRPQFVKANRARRRPEPDGTQGSISMNRRMLYRSLLLLVAGGGLAAGCWTRGPRDQWDERTRTDMVIYFRPGTPDGDILRFWDEVLNISAVASPGSNTIRGANACIGPATVDAICVSIGPGAPRRDLRARAEAWPSVLKVLEDVVPTDVTRADLGA